MCIEEPADSLTLARYNTGIIERWDVSGQEPNYLGLLFVPFY